MSDIVGDGRIDLCPHNGCAFKCCQFNQGNYIVMYPGEMDAAIEHGDSVAHLQVTDDDYHGGLKVICTAGDTATCDNGYKPLDCKSYPFFPKPGLDQAIKGSKCPLPVQAIEYHRIWVMQQWAQLPPLVRDWLSHVELVGYEEVA